MKNISLFILAVALGVQRGHAQPATGEYITLDKLAFVGFATPEATVQSVKWMSMNTNYEAVWDTCVPAVRANNHMSPEYFEGSKEYTKRRFCGFQILARKSLAEDMVELKTLNDRFLDDQKRTTNREYLIVTLVKIGKDWKFAKDTRKYDASWDEKPQPAAGK